MLKNVVFDIVVDGVDYKVEVGWDGDVVWVYDANGKTVASAEYDHAIEEVFYDYYNEECGKLEEFGGASFDLYRTHDALELAHWLCATHPEN